MRYLKISFSKLILALTCFHFGSLICTCSCKAYTICISEGKQCISLNKSFLVWHKTKPCLPILHSSWMSHDFLHKCISLIVAGKVHSGLHWLDCPIVTSTGLFDLKHELLIIRVIGNWFLWAKINIKFVIQCSYIFFYKMAPILVCDFLTGKRQWLN